MTITIKVTGLDNVQRELTATQKLPDQAIRDLSQYIFDRAEKGAGKHAKTGALERSLYNKKITGGREVGHAAQVAPYARFVHWGTRPHVIQPKKRKALRWPVDGKFIFAKRVHHPGYKGDPWLLKAVDEASRNFDQIVAGSLKKVSK